MLPATAGELTESQVLTVFLVELKSRLHIPSVSVRGPTDLVFLQVVPREH